MMCFCKKDLGDSAMVATALAFPRHAARNIRGI